MQMRADVWSAHDTAALLRKGIYSVPAAIIMGLWFVCVPAFVAPRWQHWVESINDQLTVNLILNLIPPAFIAVYSLVMLGVHWTDLPFFEQYKIGTKEWPWKSSHPAVRDEFWQLCKQARVKTFINSCVLVPIFTVLTFPLARNSGAMYLDPDKFPSYWEIFYQLCLLSAIQEFGFYWSHRLLHTSYLYARVHKIHHEWTFPVCIAAQHQHPLDYMLASIVPVVISVNIVKPHMFTYTMFVLYTMMVNMDDHCGYAFPWSPVRLIPFTSPTEAHDWHHARKITECYSSKLMVYDRMFCTDTGYVASIQAKNTHVPSKSQ
jgi:sterol desaturase/sphingolipid hydroxylase (fatty acid hydroxylase superfamily)